MKFKFDSNILLKLALEELKTDYKTFQTKYHKLLELNQAEYVCTNQKECKKINPVTKEKTFRKEVIHSTKSALVKTTQHGRIIDVQMKKDATPKAKTKPTITVKKKKLINKY